MGETIIWDVYTKTLEMRSKAIKESLKVPINTIAEKLKINADVAEECAIVLQELELIHFDKQSKEIMFPDMPADAMKTREAPLGI